MYALPESVRQMRGTAPAQIPDAKISVCHGVGGMFAASHTIITSNEGPAHSAAIRAATGMTGRGAIGISASNCTPRIRRLSAADAFESMTSVRR
jgi:hypothetical protein